MFGAHVLLPLHLQLHLLQLGPGDAAAAGLAQTRVSLHRSTELRPHVLCSDFQNNPVEYCVSVQVRQLCFSATRQSSVGLCRQFRALTRSDVTA